jgi:hypothetical protein
MCSSNSAGKITKPYYSTCVAVADFLLHIGTPKEAREHQKEIGLFCQRSMEKNGLGYLHFEFGCKILNR